ncbi:hypothetical protein BDV29DRAFT_175189 [Aspergillus leporis]|uniref:Uncharacterized protein n=1 Tax=Aspergillus leporis TaxID=41062 RepID=A0A5N5X0R4_9EURO|nr:hypothetical protein BDV29DRAFT_175189 [Aspergillus leporis]
MPVTRADAIPCLDGQLADIGADQLSYPCAHARLGGSVTFIYGRLSLVAWLGSFS